MIKILNDLNKDQFDGLAKLCFDLGKASLVLALLPAPSVHINPLGNILKIIVGLIWGIVFTYLALVLLKTKEGVK